MTDRDHFAAAALTGLLDKHDAGGDLAAWWPETACAAAYRWADAMLRAREKGTAFQDNCVSGNNREIGCPVTEPMPKEKRAEVSAEEYAEKFNEWTKWLSEWRASASRVSGQPQPTLTDAERLAISYAAASLDSLPWYQQTLRGVLERLR